MRVAVIGANGFIGSRLVEQWHLEGRADVVPIVRRPEAAAPVLRFELNCRVANALDEHELARALDGCDAVVHAAAGPRRLVTQSPACVARAAARAGTGVVIYLSSMAVHGWHAAPGTDPIPGPAAPAVPGAPAVGDDSARELAATLREAAVELRAIREALEEGHLPASGGGRNKIRPRTGQGTPEGNPGGGPSHA